MGARAEGWGAGGDATVPHTPWAGCLLGRRAPWCGGSSCDEPSSSSLGDSRRGPGLDFPPGRVSAWAGLPLWLRVSLVRVYEAVWTLLFLMLWASGTVFIFKGNFVSVI